MSNNKRTLLDSFYKHVFLVGLVIGVLLLLMIGYGSHQLAERSSVLESTLESAVSANEKTVNLKMNDGDVCLRVVNTARKQGWKEVAIGSQKLDLQKGNFAFREIYGFCEQSSAFPYFSFFR